MMGVTARVLVGDVRDRLAGVEPGSVQTCVTSPPYWGLRDYGNDGQIGLEGSPEEFVEALCLVFDEVWRVLADDGTLWLNLGDSYNSSSSNQNGTGNTTVTGGRHDRGGERRKGLLTDSLPAKSLIGIPWRVAFALQARGWFLRSEIIWHKPNPMPESVTDRPTKSHEHIFLLAKSAKYFYDHEAIKEPVAESSLERAKYAFHSDAPSTKNNALGDKQGIHVDEMGTRFVNPAGRNKRDVWTVPTKGYDGAHFAVYPTALIEPCILAGSREGDTVLDPFSGSGTTGVVALRNGRNYLGCELNPEYAELSRKRISDDCGMFGEVTVDE
jgi:DNA modification methylase